MCACVCVCVCVCVCCVCVCCVCVCVVCVCVCVCVCFHQNNIHYEQPQRARRTQMKLYEDYGPNKGVGITDKITNTYGSSALLCDSFADI